ncbi:MAG: hypothetical protein KDB23_07340 [Planctomycetales bacterium]|nr:hypothetical protein [Planctomycetales bacterium]
MIKLLSSRHWPTSVCLALLAILVLSPAIRAADPPRLKRADSFLGVHFDFHAGPDCIEVGKQTTPAMIENIIELVHPDYLQIDCKGHPGYSSYPTRVGNPVPGFVGDPLRVWREVTARRGVSLYLHYSGVWDSKAIADHPEWAARDANGNGNPNATSFYSPYARELLIPQLRELATVYGVDGVWVDGECWASVPDYGDAALEAFRATTGIHDVPRGPGDAHWFEFLEFNREAFRKYLRNYIGQVKQTNPDFQMCSNWAFTDHMPEPVSAAVDFLSGDYSPQDSVNSARLSGRLLVRQGKPWDLMAWSFSTQPDYRQKTSEQLKREAAVVVALGGGFQAYFRQKRDGSIYDEQMPVMAEVARFCRERQTLCHHSLPVPQVALLFSTASHYREINGLFSRNNQRIDGVLQALLENQHSVEVLTEHQLTGRMSQYPLIVVPEWTFLETSFKEQLRKYVSAGGSLLLIGPRSAALFADDLQATIDDGPTVTKPLDITFDERHVTLTDEGQRVELHGNARAFATLVINNDKAGQAPASSVTQLGKGQIAATYFSFGRSYRQDQQVALRQVLQGLVDQLFPEPLVTVTGSESVDVCVAQQGDKLLVNLVNTSGPHRTVSVQDSIPAVGPLKVTVRLAKPPQQVTLEPQGESVVSEFMAGKLHLRVPEVAIHTVVVVEP